jgi:hypothetical protein
MTGFEDKSDEELGEINIRYQEEKARIRASQLDLNAELTDRARRGVKKVYVLVKGTFKTKTHLIEVPIKTYTADGMALEGIESGEVVDGPSS